MAEATKIIFPDLNLSSRERFAIAWLSQKKWITGIDLHLKDYADRQRSSLLFLEWLLDKQLLTAEQFKEAIREYHQAKEWKCPACQKVFFGRTSGTQSMKCQKCATPLPIPTTNKEPDELIGNLIGGCILARKLGQGGMGAVYLAFHTRLGKWVAIKLLPQTMGINSQEKERFLLEARSGSRLEHPNIIGVLDVGEENKCYYMIQQYIEGESLRKRIERQKKLPIEEIIPILRGICSGLGHAHQNQIIHRDIKPDNIMLTLQNEVKIADFGLAKSLDKMSSLSVSGMILGTPHFMSPEQCEGKRTIDHRSDIYSLGATLFQMLTGTLPYASKTEEDSPVTVLFRHVNDPIPNPLEFSPQINPIFAQITMRCMAKKPEERFQNCSEILEYLDLYEKQQLDSIHFPTISLEPGSIPKISFFQKHRQKWIIAGIVFFLLILLGNINKKNAQKKLENVSKTGENTTVTPPTHTTDPEETEDDIRDASWEKFQKNPPTNWKEMNQWTARVLRWQKQKPELMDSKQLQTELKTLLPTFNKIIGQEAKTTALDKTNIALTRTKVGQFSKLKKQLEPYEIRFSERVQQAWQYLEWENKFLQILTQHDLPPENKLALLKDIDETKPTNPNNEVLPPELYQQWLQLKDLSQIKDLETHFHRYCESKNRERLFEIWAQLKTQSPDWKLSETLRESLRRAMIPDPLSYGNQVFRFLEEKKFDEARVLTELLWEIDSNWIHKHEKTQQERFKSFINPSIPLIFGKELLRFKKTLQESQQLLLRNPQDPETLKGILRRDFNDYKRAQGRLRSEIEEFLKKSYSAKTICSLMNLLMEDAYPDFSLIFYCVYLGDPPPDSFEVKDFRFRPTSEYEKILIAQECLKEVEILLEQFRQKASHQKNFQREIQLDNPVWNSQLLWYPPNAKEKEKHQMYLFMLPCDLLEEILSTEIQKEETLYRFCCFGILRKQLEWARVHAKKLPDSPRYQRIKKFLLEE